MSNENQKQSNSGQSSALSNEITFKFLSDSVLKTFEKEGKKYCRLTASSDGEDLVGDIMAKKALDKMEKAAVGTVMFMNHSTNVPEDVFGTVIETTLEKKSVDLTGGGKGDLYCLDYLVEVQDDNERAVKTWLMIGKGTKLGASVTVLVTDKSPNPKRNKGIVIEDIEYIETSIVGVPCNRQSWVQAAQKSLELAEKRAGKITEPAEETPLETKNGETEKSMSTETEVKTAVIGAGGTGKSAFFQRTIAAIAICKSVREQIAAKAEKIVVPEIVAKGMFNEILAQEPTLWKLYDILNEVRWTLMSQKYNLEYLGQTDFSEILATWSEALEEFKEAAIVSFKYWGDFDDAAEMVSNSIELQKSFEGLAEIFENSSDENVRGNLRETGKQILEIAKAMGIVTDSDPSVAEVQIPQPEPIEKSEKLIEMQTRAEKAEKELSEMQKQFNELEGNYAVAEAGLKVAVEATNLSLRQPLRVAQESPATS